MPPQSEERARFTADARVTTEDARGQLTRFFERLEQRAGARPELGVRIERSGTSGSAEFGWARFTMNARPRALEIRVEAVDRDGLEQVEEFVARHLEGHADDERLEVNWTPLDAGDAHNLDESGRRARMRQFHRRARRAAGPD
jgi:hypothetical protein